MKGREFTILIERDEDGYYVGEVIELPGCFTQARTVEELMKRIREEIALYLEEVGEEVNSDLYLQRKLLNLFQKLVLYLSGRKVLI